MPNEAFIFNDLDNYYKQSLKQIKVDLLVVWISKRDGFMNALKINRWFEDVIWGLSKYLDSKRELFPRFYFLSMMEIINFLG